VPRRQHPRDFGKKLHYLRVQSGFTLQELARQLGHSAHGYISELESGKKAPTVKFVLKVADLFKVSTDELIRDELNLGDSYYAKLSMSDL
jgi:transcriptional regulator with XRE-family HTH domain